MKLEAVCETCGRTFLLSEIVPPPQGTGGRCPFCGAHFARHYVASLPGLVRTVEADADAFVTSFNRLLEMHPGFHVSTQEFLRRLTEELPTSSPQDASA
jgi:hypothetical protein